jgi:hypothetical protein
MATEKISNLSERRDIELHQGASLRPVRQYLTRRATPTAEPQPVNLTGAQVRGQIRKKPSSEPIVATFGSRVAPVPTEGWIEIWLTDEQTASIACSDDITAPESLYAYDVEVEYPDGSVDVTLSGAVRIRAGVTR